MDFNNDLFTLSKGVLEVVIIIAGLFLNYRKNFAEKRPLKKNLYK